MIFSLILRAWDWALHQQIVHSTRSNSTCFCAFFYCLKSLYECPPAIPKIMRMLVKKITSSSDSTVFSRDHVLLTPFRNGKRQLYLTLPFTVTVDYFKRTMLHGTRTLEPICMDNTEYLSFRWQVIPFYCFPLQTTRDLQTHYNSYKQLMIYLILLDPGS